LPGNGSPQAFLKWLLHTQAEAIIKTSNERHLASVKILHVEYYPSLRFDRSDDVALLQMLGQPNSVVHIVHLHGVILRCAIGFEAEWYGITRLSHCEHPFDRLKKLSEIKVAK